MTRPLSIIPVLGLALAPAFATASPGPQPAPPTPPLPAPRDEPYPGTVELTVDVTDVARRIYDVHEEIPVAAPGDVILLYPRWLPGTHAPEGTIDRLAGLVVRAGATRLEWSRDPVDVFAFHVPVPAGTTRITVDFQYLSPVSRAVGAQEVAPDLLVLDWCSTVLYPAGTFARQIPVAASVRLPAGWHLATALEVASSRGDVTTFKTTSLDTVVDSPVRAGRWLRRYDLAPGDKVPVTLDLMGDRPDLVDLAPRQIELMRALVQQAYHLFGSRHYDHYDFLVQLGDDIAGDTTLEHHRSAEYGSSAEDFAEWDKSAGGRDVYAHEYVHSWDGKYRRPADLWTADFNVAMRNSLLWVYEGGTEYWGDVLTARAGLWSRQQALDNLAIVFARLDRQEGRTWRALQDTTNDEIINPRRPMSWRSWQRFEDYYAEGELIWLDADTLIRERTHGKKSLDDFARAFFGGADTSYVPAAYTFDDVVKTLNEVMPYDWAAFLRGRLDGHGPRAPLGGLERSGYRLVFSDQPSALWSSMEEEDGEKRVDHTFSLGFVVGKEDRIDAVEWGSAAWKAGVTAGSTLVAVDGLAYEPDRLKRAIQRAKGAAAPIELILRNGDRFSIVKLDYHDGLRYPRLERDPSRPALLDDILAPRKR